PSRVDCVTRSHSPNPPPCRITHLIGSPRPRLESGRRGAKNPLCAGGDWSHGAHVDGHRGTMTTLVEELADARRPSSRKKCAEVARPSDEFCASCESFQHRNTSQRGGST